MQGFHPWLWKIPWRRAWQPTPVFLSEKSQGQRSLVGHKEQDMTEHARIYCYEHSEGCSVFSRLFATTWMVTCQAPLSMEFSRQEYWSVLPLPPPGDLPNPGIEPGSQTLQADFLLSEPPGKPKNTGVDSLALPQGIFPKQESNQGHLHCRQTLCRLRLPGETAMIIGRTQNTCLKNQLTLLLYQ